MHNRECAYNQGIIVRVTGCLQMFVSYNCIFFFTILCSYILMFSVISNSTQV